MSFPNILHLAYTLSLLANKSLFALLEFTNKLLYSVGEEFHPLPQLVSCRYALLSCRTSITSRLN